MLYSCIVSVDNQYNISMLGGYGRMRGWLDILNLKTFVIFALNKEDIIKKKFLTEGKI
jgi:hypothetical protein